MHNSIPKSYGSTWVHAIIYERWGFGGKDGEVLLSPKWRHVPETLCHVRSHACVSISYGLSQRVCSAHPQLASLLCPSSTLLVTPVHSLYLVFFSPPAPNLRCSLHSPIKPLLTQINYFSFLFIKKESTKFNWFDFLFVFSSTLYVFKDLSIMDGVCLSFKSMVSLGGSTYVSYIACDTLLLY